MMQSKYGLHTQIFIYKVKLNKNTHFDMYIDKNQDGIIIYCNINN